ncbi:hypothetical protein VTN96DRAFT_113 [Rasamsonia emersonii]|uniref:Uncharacterized protein n=1 Tax=Rasamsonia emersonii (strain ATCC 16479 / CBS 393.64 / IMI 116815) TaxID=1408163 RepID=A0A0F4YN17_RASE3|nr:hypothetical protein T310_6811 [Rasamsonia emersonii CBS 393.64]KKA19236.1 hypothetical protein T310_6811 [Rasamsonia emersonii CBS 393.64]
MPTVLLPASAAAFAPRGAPNVVLGSKVEPWLTATLKRVNRVKRPLNNVTQHTKCLTETLSLPNAIWTLCSLMFPKAPDAELRKDENPLVEAIFNYQMIHMEAYVVHVDMVSQNEVAFKLTPETIEALVEFHKEVYSVDTAASTWDWPDKEAQLKKLQEEFVQAVNKFIFRTHVQALEGLEEDGSGELLCGRSEEAKAAILSLFVPLLPPPPAPRIVDVLRPAPLLPSSTVPEDWWSTSIQPQPQPVPVEPWKVVPSSPSPVSTGDTNPNMWTGLPLNEAQLPSPAPSLSQPYTTSAYNAPQVDGAPTTMAALAALPLPSMLVQPCSTAANMAGFGWGDRYQDLALSYGTTM